MPNRLNVVFASTPSTPQKKPKSPNTLHPPFDVYNKALVRQAIDSAPSVQNRIQIVDQILKRRKELTEAENELKLERAAPIIRKLSMNYRNRMKKAQSNEGRISFKKSMFAVMASQNNSPAFRPSGQSEGFDKTNQSEVESLRNSAEHSFSPYIDAMKGNIELARNPTESSYQGGMSPSPFDLNRGTGYDEISRLDLNELTKKESESSNLAQSNGTQGLRLKNAKNKIAFLLRQKTTGTQRGLVFGDENQDQSTQAQIETGMNSSFKKRFPQKRKSLAATMIIAKEKIEKDLYKFLVKNDSDKHCKNVVYTSHVRRSITENIESKVKDKYKTFVENKKKISYFLPSSFILSKQALPEVSSPRVKFIFLYEVKSN